MDFFGTRHVCVFRNTHVYAPWVQPSIDFFCNTHVCVLLAAIYLLKLLSVRTFT